MDNKHTARVRKVKYITGIIFCVSMGYLLAALTRPVITSPIPSTSIIRYLFSQKKDRQNPQTEVSDITQEDDEQQPSYIVDIPAKYFDPENTYNENSENIVLTGENLAVSNPPIAIERPGGIEAINEKYDPKEKLLFDLDFGPDVYGYDIDNDGFFEDNIKEGESIDVDNDGRLERVIYGSTAMTHQPNIAVVVKDGRIIYKSDRLGHIYIFGSESKNGFYVSEEFSIGQWPSAGGFRRTRFIYEDGKFIPVWYRESFLLQTTKP